MSEGNTNIFLPMIALTGQSVLPGSIVHFDLKDKKQIRVLLKTAEEKGRIFLAVVENTDTDKPQREDLFDCGTIAQIKNTSRLPGNVLRVVVEGESVGVLHGISQDENEPAIAEVESVSWEPLGKDADMTEIAEMRALMDILHTYVQETHALGRETMKDFEEESRLARMVHQILLNIPLTWKERQDLIGAITLEERYDLLCTLLATGVETARIRNGIQAKVKERIDKNQRDYILREQVKVIEKELGSDGPESEADRYEKELQQLDAPDVVKEKLQREIRRFRTLGGASAEASVASTYIETILDMPWNKASEDSQDLKAAKKILDEDHYGLEKVKERILEFLAVRQLTKKGDSPIICLAGPPGTGKTSIARSVAKALDKKYVRISLGGVHDEAEIRGHRRTYIGAMPGRIATAIRTSGVRNPLMLLDEIDKVSADYRGDTASALLEVLDSEQNSKFRDHYLDLPLDLSDVLFIATANDLQSIPGPLRDRMEIIEVSSYTENEKKHIAKEHLLPKQKERHGLTEKQLTVSPKAMDKIITGYTREAGVRSLERKIGEICRKSARMILEDGKANVKVKQSNLNQFLGRAIYEEEMKALPQDEVGIVRGLAWTAVGGVTLQVEVSIMPGKGVFMLTGQMGDVMKESAQTAVSVVRSLSVQYGVDPEFFQKNDIHIHIPEGAVPKDGPSAGITMTTAILSAVLDVPVRADTAMTGEITLRGRVLPIGGLKEKLLAAGNAGIKQVLVPQKNTAEVAEISEEITGGLTILGVSSIEDVLRAAMPLLKDKKTNKEERE